jgi:hypothetical protein
MNDNRIAVVEEVQGTQQVQSPAVHRSTLERFTVPTLQVALHVGPGYELLQDDRVLGVYDDLRNKSPALKVMKGSLVTLKS